MIFHFLRAFGGMLWLGIHLPLLLLALLALLLWSRGVADRLGGGFRIHAGIAALVWLELAANDFLFDLDPDLLLLQVVSLPLLFLAAGAGPASGPAPARRWVLLAAAAPPLVWLAAGPEALRALQLLAWAACVGALVATRARFLRGSDWIACALLAALLLQLANLGAGWLPAALLDRGRLLGEGSVYSFCEIPERRALYAARVSCNAESIEDCRDDYVVEYDSESLEPVARHRFFDASFYGRMLYLLCLDDRVQVGMSTTQNGTRRTSENVLEFPVDAPGSFVRDLLQAPYGVVMLHDPVGRRIFYTSEFSNRVLLVDHSVQPARRQLFSLPGARVFPPPYGMGILAPRVPGSLATMVDARSERRGTGFFAEWIRGRKAVEIDLESLAQVAVYPANDGGISSLSVDPELGRLFTTGLWGVEVFDLASGRLILRRRTEFGPRLPLVDSAHGLVYVTATFGNHIEIWDRESLSRLARLTVGIGGRNAYLASDGRHYFSSAFGRHYAWETDALAERAGRRATGALPRRARVAEGSSAAETESAPEAGGRERPGAAGPRTTSPSRPGRSGSADPPPGSAGDRPR